VSPAYVAVIGCEPIASEEVVNVAVLFAVIAVLPNSVAPSKKLILPVAVIVPVVLTVAVNVTDPPVGDGFSELVTAIVVVAALTT
jgi:hypothetical protein